MSIMMPGGDRKFDLFVTPYRSREVTYKITKHNAWLFQSVDKEPHDFNLEGCSTVHLPHEIK